MEGVVELDGWEPPGAAGWMGELTLVGAADGVAEADADAGPWYSPTWPGFPLKWTAGTGTCVVVVLPLTVTETVTVV